MRTKGFVRELENEKQQLTKRLSAIEQILEAVTLLDGKGSLGRPRKRKGISAEGRKRIAAAQRARWAKIKAKGRRTTAEAKAA